MCAAANTTDTQKRDTKSTQQIVSEFMSDWKERGLVWEGVMEGEERREIRGKEEAWVGGWDWVGGKLLTLMNEIKLTLLVYAVYLVFW